MMLPMNLKIGLRKLLVKSSRIFVMTASVPLNFSLAEVVDRPKDFLNPRDPYKATKG